jgi:succinyl-diaminopimelate desuccinylase
MRKLVAKHPSTSCCVTEIIDPVKLTMESVRCKSVTPADDGALDVMAKVLEPLGFNVRRLRFEQEGTAPIDNIFARRGYASPHLCYMGHTDVVPAGNEGDWISPPFEPVIRDGKLYGRGVADMKGGNAAFAAAASRFLAEHPDMEGSISLLLTGDEEAVSVNGSVKVIGWMKEHGHIPDVALVGEPSNPQCMGEVVRVGRRGSLGGHLVVTGVQGHSAYPERADNPIPHMLRYLDALINADFDTGTEDFPATHLAVTTVDTGNTAGNIIPARCEARFNMRFNDKWTKETLDKNLRKILDGVRPNGYCLTTSSNAPCFLTKEHPWRDIVMGAVKKVHGRRPIADTGGGASDARFMAPYCPVVEYGLVNHTIHKVDEHAALQDIEYLTQTYLQILRDYFLA